MPALLDGWPGAAAARGSVTLGRGGRRGTDVGTVGPAGGDLQALLSGKRRAGGGYRRESVARRLHGRAACGQPHDRRPAGRAVKGGHGERHREARGERAERRVRGELPAARLSGSISAAGGSTSQSSGAMVAPFWISADPLAA
jgi:hypothetical protein